MKEMPQEVNIKGLFACKHCGQIHPGYRCEAGHTAALEAAWRAGALMGAEEGVRWADSHPIQRGDHIPEIVQRIVRDLKPPQPKEPQ